jgi:hypothetical protein
LSGFSGVAAVVVVVFCAVVSAVWVAVECEALVPPQPARATAAAMPMKSARPMDPLVLSIDASS